MTEQYAWLGPKKGQRLYEPKPEDWKTFATLAGFPRGDRPGDARHRSRLRHLREAGSARPGQRHAVYHAMDLNFPLKPASKAVDAGVVIPTVNDGFDGKAPDLGALEVGAPPPRMVPAG